MVKRGDKKRRNKAPKTARGGDLCTFLKEVALGKVALPPMKRVRSKKRLAHQKDSSRVRQ